MSAYFHSKANFENTVFREGANFYKAILPDTMDFRFVKNVGREIDFTYCLPPRYSNKCLIALADADISKIKLRMDLFKLWFPADSVFNENSTGIDSIIAKIDTSSTLDITGIDSAKSVIDTVYKKGIWVIDSLTYDHKVSIYEQLLNKIKDDGLKESYKILDIDYRQFKYEHQRRENQWNVFTPIGHYWNVHWWNYGYNKEKVFWWTFLLLFIFTLLNITCFNKLNESIYPIDFLKRTDYQILSGYNSSIYYIICAAMYTAIIFFRLKISVSNFGKGAIRKHPWLFTYFMLIYVSGLICLGFIANIIFTGD